jgi:hypothetical protein
MPTADLIQAVRELSSKELEKLLDERGADTKALRVLWRAAIAREREERRQRRQQPATSSAINVEAKR